MKALLASIVGALLAATSSATLFWSGSLDGTNPVFNRPSSMLGISFTGTAVSYDVQAFHVGANGDYIFESGQSYDGFILVYKSTFDPRNPLHNLVGGGDDFTPDSGSGNPSNSNQLIDPWNYTFGSKLDTPANGFGNLSLLSGEQYFAVTTAFGNADQGNYFNAIGGGPGDVRTGVVPEPATLLVLGAGLIGIAKRKRSR